MNGKVYKLVGNGKIYIGSTTVRLCNRKAGHIANCKLYGDCTSREIVSDPNFYIELIENVPCNSKEELFIRERYWIENTDCVNKLIPYKTKEERKEMAKQYREANKDKIREEKKKQYQDNKEEIKERARLYREANKDKIKEREKQYREANKEEKKQRDKEYYETNKDKIKEQKKQYYQAKKSNLK